MSYKGWKSWNSFGLLGNHFASSEVPHWHGVMTSRWREKWKHHPLLYYWVAAVGWVKAKDLFFYSIIFCTLWYNRIGLAGFSFSFFIVFFSSSSSFSFYFLSVPVDSWGCHLPHLKVLHIWQKEVVLPSGYRSWCLCAFSLHHAGSSYIAVCIRFIIFIHTLWGE